jgi:hypothetical protein
LADNEQLILSISADTRAMQRQLDKLVGQIGTVDNNLDGAFKNKTANIDNVAKSLNKTKFETANLAAQFQDIAVQLQGGASPFTVALQQGTQINQVLGRQGATGVVSLLGAAFSSLLTPVSLATIGIIALGGYAVQYGAKAIGAVDDLDDKLKKHAELIKSLKDAYGEAGSGIDVAVKDSITVLKTLLGLSTTDLQKQFRNLSNAVVASVTDYTALGDAAGQYVETSSKKFAAFKGPIDDFRASVAAGTPDVKAFRRAVSEIEQTTADEKTKKLAGELLASTEAAGKAQSAIEGTAKATRLLSAEMQAAADQGEAFAKAMKRLEETVQPDLSPREKIMQEFTDALVKADGTESRLAASRLRDTKLQILADNERKKAAEESARDAESAAKRFESAMNSSARQTAKVMGATPALSIGIANMSRMMETSQ